MTKGENNLERLNKMLFTNSNLILPNVTGKNITTIRLGLLQPYKNYEYLKKFSKDTITSV